MVQDLVEGVDGDGAGAAIAAAGGDPRSLGHENGAQTVPSSHHDDLGFFGQGKHTTEQVDTNRRENALSRLTLRPVADQGDGHWNSQTLAQAGLRVEASLSQVGLHLNVDVVLRG